jgi:phosphonopyruvate decarboxylase
MMDVAEATRAIEAERGDALAVITMSPLGFWQDARPDDFRLLGTMGAAGSIGLGLALGRPDRRVWVLDGDGSLLMQLGITSAIAGAAPANLTHVVIDNGVYAISGAQPMPTAVDWAGLATAAGYASARACDTADELRAALREPGGGPRMVVARCARERPAYPPGVFQSIDSAAEAGRVRAALAA